jgi:hypothetical protein
MEVPGSEFSEGSIIFYRNGKVAKELLLSGSDTAEDKELAGLKADMIVFKSGVREYSLKSARPTDIILRNDFIGQPAYLNDPSPRQIFTDSDPNMQKADYQVYFTMIRGNVRKGQSVKMDFEVRASGTIDRRPANITLDTLHPGRKFDGIGGNFRLQFPENDPAVIDYCLENLNVTWGRVPFYWDQWHPEEIMDPVVNAMSGGLSERFNKQMEMAVRLAKMKIPVIFSVWWPPRWAVDPEIKVPRGLVLDNDKIDKISNSIASFFQYAKTVYGIEADYFSFNEADYGVEVFQTPEDHAFQLREIGLCLVSRGLKTKILIGDTGAGTAKASRIMSIIEKDPELHKYAGAVSFHTYHGVTTPDLLAWAASADNTNLPVMVAEGGSNSAAHRYPLIFLQPWFQLDEIDKYIRICAICQPVTIMEWQLTADYSVLTGKGWYGDTGPLRPTQRFWNLKQLGLTPEGSFALPVSCDRTDISCAGFGDILNGNYTIHLVNNGSSREVVLTGLPAGITTMKIYVTDAERGMSQVNEISVESGKTRFILDKSAYTTLTGTVTP